MTHRIEALFCRALFLAASQSFLKQVGSFAQAQMPHQLYFDFD